ncbi:TolC family protein [Pelovirga terrestris]|uniref:TolC family protein n=1 Tax=Pelovirga terrestris TaxID=2771352 RepID=A0A8J6R4J2_9BACT|nr:TolC family protein [Pelovirga terrestris]
MKTSSAVLFALFGLFCPLLSWSAPSSLNELIVLGLRTNTELQINQLEINKAHQAIVIEQAMFDPEAFTLIEYEQGRVPFVNDPFYGRMMTRQYQGAIGLRQRFTTGMTASARLLTERFSGFDASSTLDPRYRSSLVLEFNQPLLRNVGRVANRTAIDRAGYQLQQTELGFLLHAQQLALQLEYALRRLALHRHITGLRNEALILAERLVEFNRRRFDEGLVAITEIQGAEATLAQRHLLLAQAQQEHDLLYEQLNRQLGGQLPAEFNPLPLFADEMTPGTNVNAYPVLLETARAKRLDRQIAQLSLASQQRQLDFYHQQLKPQLDLRLQAGLNGLAGRQPTDTPYRGDWGDSFTSLSSADGYQWGVALEFSIPLGNRAAQSRQRQAQVTVQQQHYRISDLDLNIRTQIREGLLELKHALEQQRISAEFERLASIALRQEQRRLDEGLSDTFRLVSFQDKMIDARIARLQADTACHLAHANLTFVIGEIFDRYQLYLDANGEVF